MGIVALDVQANSTNALRSALRVDRADEWVQRSSRGEQPLAGANRQPGSRCCAISRHYLFAEAWQNHERIDHFDLRAAATAGRRAAPRAPAPTTRRC